LNDDVKLFPGALVELLNVEKFFPGSIICGITCSEKNKDVTYGGNDSEGNLLVPNGAPQLCDGVFNGNLVLVPKVAFAKVGNLDLKFRHAIGDFDYALRARKKGVTTYVVPGFSGVCEKNESLPKWCLSNVTLYKRIQSLYSPLGNAQPKYFFIYEMRHFGLVLAIKHLLTIHLRALIPSLWKQ
jgi:GT2 family glycosyltransferase